MNERMIELAGPQKESESLLRVRGWPFPEIIIASVTPF